jgi:DNA-binding transcriptional LysR family regulator
MNQDIELRHLRYFVAVAEEMHFGRAAARLGIAQPPLSQQIRRLEALIDAQLFDRTSRRVALTDAGATLLEGARRILGQTEDLVEEVGRMGRGEAGSVTVAFGAALMFHELPRVIREFRRRVPAVHLELRELSTGQQLDALHAGDVDIGFLREPGPDTGLHVETVMDEPLVVALPARHPLAGGSAGKATPITLAALASDDFVLFPREVAPGLHARVFALCRDAGFTPNVVQESREQYTTMALVAAEVGITIIPASVQQLEWRGVVYKDIPSALARSHIAMAWRSGAVSPAVDAFAQLVRQLLAGTARPHGR